MHETTISYKIIGGSSGKMNTSARKDAVKGRIARARGMDANQLNLNGYGLGKWTDEELKTLFQEISGLRFLSEINLSDNDFLYLPSCIGEMGKAPRLAVLDLTRNPLTVLPSELGNIERLKILSIDTAQLIDPPPEIIQQGTAATIAYLHERLAGVERQWSSKILLVGEGGVGKTQLLRALRKEPFEIQSETTHGISIQQFHLPHPTSPTVNMELNCWDFGGQQIYHATHQFFLTNRSLVTIQRKKQKEVKKDLTGVF